MIDYSFVLRQINFKIDKHRIMFAINNFFISQFSEKYNMV